MGCTQSKIENEQGVNRCQERKQHMKHAIPARNAFASAHSAYAVALKNTGAALGDYAASEVQHPQFYPGGPSGAVASAAAAQLPIEEEEENEENELGNDESSNLRQRSSRGARDISGGGGGSGSSESGRRKEVVAENEAPKQGATSPQRTQHEIDECFFPPLENVTAPTSGEVAAEELRVDNKHSAEKGKVGMTPDVKRVAKADISFAQIFFELGDHFQKASESVPEVSKMLKVIGLHLHPNSADNHGSPNADDVKDDIDSEENEIDAAMLDELLVAWEEKLYDGVKTGEHLNYERQKKVAAVNRQNRGDHSESLEKKKAATRKLYIECKVNMCSVNSTVSEIERLRDEQLYPQLIQLVDEMAKMWEAMRICHESQYKTVKNLAFLEVDQATKEKSEHHHDRTLQLFKAVVDWHEQFKNVVDNQKNYMKVLKNWLELTVIPIESSFGETVSTSQNNNPLIWKLVHAWEENLEKLPDEPARTAINKAREVFGAIVHDQEEEMKFKEKREKTNLELSRKRCSLSKWHREVMPPRTPSDDRHIAKKEVAVQTLGKRFAKEDDAYQGQCLKVRQNTLKSFKDHLPELFGALSKFAIASSEMYGNLRSLS